MTCIGQSKFRASSEYVHLQCTHQPTHESSLRSLQVIAAQFISIALGCCKFWELFCCIRELLRCIKLVAAAGLHVQGTSGVPVLASDRASGEGRSLVPLDEELEGAVPLHMLPAVDIRSVSLSYSNSGYRLFCRIRLH